MEFILFIFMAYHYAVFPVEARNVDSSVFFILADYLRDELSSYGSVLEKGATYELMEELLNCKTDSCYFEFCKKYDIENLVFVYADRLGEKYIVRVKVFNRAKGFIFNEKDIADRESDLDILMQRFKEAIVKGKPLEKIITTETITLKESEEEPRKRRTRKHIGGRIGSIFPLTGYYESQEEKPFLLTRLILGIHYEVKNMGIGAETAFFARGWGFEFPIRYFVSNTDYTPYFEFVPSYYLMPDIYSGGGYFNGGDKIAGGNGPGIGIGSGYAFFHTYDVQFIINAKYLFILNNGPDSGFEITFGILFGGRD